MEKHGYIWGIMGLDGRSIIPMEPEAFHTQLSIPPQNPLVILCNISIIFIALIFIPAITLYIHGLTHDPMRLYPHFCPKDFELSELIRMYARNIMSIF